MTSEGDNFDRSGPLRLTCVDWSNEDHRRCVAACLVNGVYVLEEDREQVREGPRALAPRWWEFFGFQLHTKLVDPLDLSIFGAMYELMQQSYNSKPASTNTTKEAPRYVIAFRGIQFKRHAFVADYQHYFLLGYNGLHKSSRANVAVKYVQDQVAAFGKSSLLWLAGHSLGASIAMLAGKTMAKKGVFLETFLFNPPYVSTPIEMMIKNEKLRDGARIAGSYVVAGLTTALEAFHGHPEKKKGTTTTVAAEEDPFVVLSEWVPRLYVHRGDPVCAEYIGYFNHRKKMEDKGAGDIEAVATRNSLRALLLSPLWKTTETLHLIPSAILTTTPSVSICFALIPFWAVSK